MVLHLHRVVVMQLLPTSCRHQACPEAAAAAAAAAGMGGAYDAPAAVVSIIRYARHAFNGAMCASMRHA
jgi:hypothetical protein